MARALHANAPHRIPHGRVFSRSLSFMVACPPNVATWLQGRQHQKQISSSARAPHTSKRCGQCLVRRDGQWVIGSNLSWCWQSRDRPFLGNGYGFISSPVSKRNGCGFISESSSETIVSKPADIEISLPWVQEKFSGRKHRIIYDLSYAFSVLPENYTAASTHRHLDA